MRYFPVFLDLTSKTCLVVGAGPVGRRKISTLKKSCAGSITVIDPGSVKEPLLEDESIQLVNRVFKPGDVEGCHLVFACTADHGTNQQVVQACRERNVWCNSATDPDQGDIVLPAVLERGDLLLAVSTCGASPALSARVKKELASRYGPEYALLTTLMSRVRKLVLPLGLPQADNQKIFHAILDSHAAEILKSGDREGLQNLLQDLLPAGTHKHIQEMTHALF
ncbi:bifunctional precorrin-2 dehydrogenase/sirohydrochlorin ferrochelatase [Desulfonatronospira sp.]|uniref:precorrin-2 dehydrogenase/sirohydrochlorin ferrochelatase family protein n=1 Tax=Desulfonatronospira sp. TaxID=1962951 RepID=UPI0025BD6950|nr:bifunctional precorrin-2 dehydrogenase/sirohydrochlorin ferrochelatase [Desulfonatronospira sp.]